MELGRVILARRLDQWESSSNSEYTGAHELAICELYHRSSRVTAVCYSYLPETGADWLPCREELKRERPAPSTKRDLSQVDLLPLDTRLPVHRHRRIIVRIAVRYLVGLDVDRDKFLCWSVPCLSR